MNQTSERGLIGILPGEFAMTSIVLAGGRSSRLGREKSRELVGRESLIAIVVSRLSSLSDEILIVVSQSQSNSSFPSCAKAKTVVDLYPGKGALGGIYTGLAYSSSFHNLAVACDMPFLNISLLRYMVRVSPGFDVVMPRMGDHREPLHAVYTRDCLLPMERQLRKGNLRAADFPDSVSTRYVERKEIGRFDPEFLSFFNINTQVDLERARTLASQGTPQETMLEASRMEAAT